MGSDRGLESTEMNSLWLASVQVQPCVSIVVEMQAFKHICPYLTTDPWKTTWHGVADICWAASGTTSLVDAGKVTLLASVSIPTSTVTSTSPYLTVSVLVLR